VTDPFLPLTTYDRCAARAVYLEAHQPMPIVFGRVPHPPVTDRVIPDAHNVAWSRLGARTVRGVVYHRMLGSLWGTDTWFRTLDQANGDPGGGRRGLTDYGVDAGTAALLKWNEPTGVARPSVPGGGFASAHRSGHASGGPGGPSGDGVAFVQRLGAVAINRDLVSIEISGGYDDDVSPAAFERIAQLSAYWADQARIPWSEYPTDRETGLAFTYWHNEFQTEKPCPGARVMALTGQLIERTKAILRQHQEATTATTTTAAPPPATTPTPATTTTAAPQLPGADARLPPGMTPAMARARFGKFVTARGVYDYQPTQPLSKLWVEEGRATGRWPTLWGVDDDGFPRFFTFQDGSIVIIERDTPPRWLRV
jgi:hypothetical protein